MSPTVGLSDDKILELVSFYFMSQARLLDEYSLFLPIPPS